MKSTGWIVAAAGALGVALAAGLACSSQKSDIPVAANQLGPDDPLAAGQDLFLHSTWGLEALNAWPTTDFMLNLMKSEPAVFGNQFANSVSCRIRTTTSRSASSAGRRIRRAST